MLLNHLQKIMPGTDNLWDRFQKSNSKLLYIILSICGGIPYTAHGAQITPPLILNFCLSFIFMLILG